MYAYVTELSKTQKFSQSYIFSDKYKWNINTKSKSLGEILKYKENISKSKKVELNFDKAFKFNRSIDYVSINRMKIASMPDKCDSISLNKKRRGSMLMRKQDILNQMKSLQLSKMRTY